VLFVGGLFMCWSNSFTFRYERSSLLVPHAIQSYAFPGFPIIQFLITCKQSKEGFEMGL